MAADRGFSTYDGGTTCAKFRIVNIDTPEIEGKSAYECRLAIERATFPGPGWPKVAW
jgi:hypothetical protein